MSSFTTQELSRSIDHNTSYDAFKPAFTPAQWMVFANYLQVQELPTGQVLIEQGAKDQTVFFIESGALSVHAVNPDGQMHLAVLNAGSVVGEGAFFSGLPRSANVIATAPCRLWRLTSTRFVDLVNRQPAVAVELAMALGAVIAKRMRNRPKRVAVT